MHAKDSALCLALSHHSVDANYLRGSGKEFWVFRGKRGYFLKRDHRGFKGALASELAIKEDTEFGCVEIGEEEAVERDIPEQKHLFPFVSRNPASSWAHCSCSVNTW